MSRLINIEGLEDWNITIPKREPGISAMVRLLDEAEWMIVALESIEWCDEIAICLNGEQHDGTDRLAKEWAKDRKHVFVYTYPFECIANGPGHDEQPINSVHERAYFYNWCLSKTTRSHVLKWDGDMLADSKLKDKLTGDCMRMNGLNVTRQGMKQISPRTPLYFKVTLDTYFKTGSMCEQFISRESELIPGNSFMHFKWMKSTTSITKAWPVDWQSMPHFTEMVNANA